MVDFLLESTSIQSGQVVFNLVSVYHKAVLFKFLANKKNFFCSPKEKERNVLNNLGKFSV